MRTLLCCLFLLAAQSASADTTFVTGKPRLEVGLGFPSALEIAAVLPATLWLDVSAGITTTGVGGGAEIDLTVKMPWRRSWSPRLTLEGGYEFWGNLNRLGVTAPNRLLDALQGFYVSALLGIEVRSRKFVGFFDAGIGYLRTMSVETDEGLRGHVWLVYPAVRFGGQF